MKPEDRALKYRIRYFAAGLVESHATASRQFVYLNLTTGDALLVDAEMQLALQAESALAAMSNSVRMVHLLAALTLPNALCGCRHIVVQRVGFIHQRRPKLSGDYDDNNGPENPSHDPIFFWRVHWPGPRAKSPIFAERLSPVPYEQRPGILDKFLCKQFNFRSISIALVKQSYPFALRIWSAIDRVIRLPHNSAHETGHIVPDKAEMERARESNLALKGFEDIIVQAVVEIVRDQLHYAPPLGLVHFKSWRVMEAVPALQIDCGLLCIPRDCKRASKLKLERVVSLHLAYPHLTPQEEERWNSDRCCRPPAQGRYPFPETPAIVACNAPYHWRPHRHSIDYTGSPKSEYKAPEKPAAQPIISLHPVAPHLLESQASLAVRYRASETPKKCRVIKKLTLPPAPQTRERGTRHLNIVDGKIYIFISEADGLVTFKREGRETLRYLSRVEFDKRFFTQEEMR